MFPQGWFPAKWYDENWFPEGAVTGAEPPPDMVGVGALAEVEEVDDGSMRRRHRMPIWLWERRYYGKRW